MTKEKEQPVANQYLAIVDSMFTQIVLPIELNCPCEICKTEIPSKEYDENLGVCNNCNARLE